MHLSSLETTYHFKLTFTSKSITSIMAPGGRKPSSSNKDSDQTNQNNKDVPQKKPGMHVKYPLPEEILTYDLHSPNSLDHPSIISTETIETPTNTKKNTPNSFVSVDSMNMNSSINDITKSSPGSLLARFGIQASTSPVATRGFNNSVSILKCCLIDTAENAAIVFRLEAKNQPKNTGTWMEKLFVDALNNALNNKFVLDPKNVEINFVQALNIETKCMFWFHDNQPQMNARGFCFRLFVIKVAKVPSQESTIELATYLCEQLNKLDKKNEGTNNATTVELHESDFFWKPSPNTVWADVIGINAALDMLQKAKGTPGNQDYYVTHKSFIDSLFHSGTYSIDLAEKLYAPVEEIDPSLRASHDINDTLDEDL
jgi:hypothetical protein